MHRIIPYGRQDINQDDIDAVTEVLKSDYLTQGPTITKFEKKFAEYVGSKFAVAVSNATAGLHLAIKSVNKLKKGKVITTPNTFIASSNSILYNNLEVDFCDINPETYLIDLELLESMLVNSKIDEYIGIICVNYAGYVLNYEKLYKIAKKYNLWIIEDACHSPGGHYIDNHNNEIKSGSGTHTDLSVFSFHPVKHIACGEGGMITTNNEELYNKLLCLRSHGIQQNKNLNENNHGGWYYEMQMLGYNYRLTDIQCALGISQLNRAKEGIYKRRKIASNYFNKFKNSPFILGQSGIIGGHAYHLYIIQVKNRDELFNYLRLNNVIVQIHYIPIYLMPYYKKLGYKEENYTNANNFYKTCLSLPIYPTLTDEEQDHVINLIYKFYESN